MLFLDSVALYPVLRDGFSVLIFVFFCVTAFIPVFTHERTGEQLSLSLMEMTRPSRYEDSVRGLVGQLQQPKHGAFCARHVGKTRVREGIASGKFRIWP